MYGNGVLIGMIRTTIAALPRIIPKVLSMAPIACCEAAHGMIALFIAALRLDTTSHPENTSIITLGFVASKTSESGIKGSLISVIIPAAQMVSQFVTHR